MSRESKYLSLLLRHKPEKENLVLDKNGYVLVKEILIKLSLTIDELNNIVETNNKKRFEFNTDKTKIRARQGHSIKVDLELKKKVPPIKLYHGTNNKFLKSILKKGLLKMNRQHVHLSEDIETATNVGKRKGKGLVILKINTKEMFKDGYNFYISNNNVWLINHVPSKYINYNNDKD